MYFDFMFYNFRVNKEPLNCICSGVVNTETGKSVNVKFDLGFTGDVSAEKIKEIINEKARSIFKDGFEFIYIDNFLVNVKSKTPETTTIPNYGIIGLYTFIVHVVV
jgi:hypothetical protein